MRGRLIAAALLTALAAPLGASFARELLTERELAERGIRVTGRIVSLESPFQEGAPGIIYEYHVNGRSHRGLALGPSICPTSDAVGPVGAELGIAYLAERPEFSRPISETGLPSLRRVLRCKGCLLTFAVSLSAAAAWFIVIRRWRSERAAGRAVAQLAQRD